MVRRERNVLNGENSTNKSPKTEVMLSIKGKLSSTEWLEPKEAKERDVHEEVGKCQVEESHVSQGHN